MSPILECECWPTPFAQQNIYEVVRIIFGKKNICEIATTVSLWEEMNVLVNFRARGFLFLLDSKHFHRHWSINMLFCRKQTVLWFLTLFCWGNVFVEALKQKLTRNFSFISFVNDVSNTLLSRWQESLIFKYDDNEVY